MLRAVQSVLMHFEQSLIMFSQRRGDGREGDGREGDGREVDGREVDGRERDVGILAGKAVSLARSQVMRIRKMKLILLQNSAS